MKIPKNLLRKLNIVLGIISVATFVYAILVFSRLKPKMVSYTALTTFEESLFTGLGLGLLFLMLFYLFSLMQIINYVKHAQIINFLSIFLIVSVVLCLVFVFSDWALISDIYKQYHHQFAQPEWSLLYPIIGFQFSLTILFEYIHISGFLVQKDVEDVARDVNLFLTLQYTGVICGLMGLIFTSLGFKYPTAWNFLVHGLMTSMVLLFPYTVVLIFWIVTKLREKDWQWFDEKQRLDVGKSALVTLVINTLFMILLFIINFPNLDGVVQFLWLPFYLFSVISLFSLGNVIFSSKT